MIIDKSWDEPGFQYPANGLDKDLFNYNRTTSIVAKHVYPRMFPGAPINGLGASDVEKNAIRRVAYYMNRRIIESAKLRACGEKVRCKAFAYLTCGSSTALLLLQRLDLHCFETTVFADTILSIGFLFD